MHCPFCQAEKDSLKVIDSRSCDGGRSIRRRRECLKCDKRFTTYERVEAPQRLTVIKKDGRRQPWDRGKILSGLDRACFKLRVAQTDLHRVADEVEEEALRHHDREVPTEFVGKLVAEKLRRLDQVAYVRFASVHRQFKTLEELVSEARAVLEARRYDDPGQGKLFVDQAEVAAAIGPEDEVNSVSAGAAPGTASSRGRGRNGRSGDGEKPQDSREAHRAVRAGASDPAAASPPASTAH
jgi:transcriptional repressor NrdR